MAKRIGFYDNKLENWHANTYLEILRDKLPDSGYEISVCKSLDEADGRAWASKNNIPYADSIEEFAAKCDYIMILAPSDPELHLQMAETILPLGKTTFIDKTFAPDLATAQRIFELADKNGVAVITTSALRFCDEFKAVVDEVGKNGVKHMSMWGGGSSFEEYSIHPVEGIISTMGSDVTHVMRWGDKQFSQVDMKFVGGRTATAYLYVSIAVPYMAVLTTEKESKFLNVDSPIFETQTKHIMDFFAKGEPTIPREESLTVREILDIANNPNNRDKWVPTRLAGKEA